MKSTDINPNTKTGTVYKLAFEILNANPDGVRWVDLNRLISEADPTLHPKTINGCVWKLVERFPDEVHKPENGLFKLR